MKRINILTAIFSMSLLVLALPAIASAQYGQYDPYGRNGQYDSYGRNGGYYGNGQYGNYGDMRSTVRDLKHRARELQRHLDNDLDHSRYDGSRREDQLNDLARRFRNEVEALSESNNRNYGGYGGGYGRRDNRVDRVLDLGNQLGRRLSRSRLDDHIQDIWSGIQYDLNTLGNAYGYNGRYNNRGYGNGGYNTGKPSWWPF